MQPGLARVHDQHLQPRADQGFGKTVQAFVVVLIVHADAAFHRHRNADGSAHRRHAVGHQRGLAHQAGAEAARLHAIGRAADIEIDLVVAPLRADARRLRQLRRFVAAELQRERMLGCIEIQQTRAIAMQDRAGRHHLGIQTRIGAQQTMEEPAMPVGPVHHGRNTEAPGRHFRDLMLSCRACGDPSHTHLFPAISQLFP